MLFDMNLTGSPILTYLEIDGTLIFDDASDQTLRSKNILVRAGSLIIGTAAKPY
jgi:G8 domain